MNHFLTLIISLTLSSLSYSAYAAVVSTTVGQVQDQIITSREVSLHFFIENALIAKPKQFKEMTAPALESRSFAHQVNSLLLEKVVFMESQGFAVSHVGESEINEALKKVESRLKDRADWKRLEPSTKEVRALIHQMLQSKKFIQFKADSSVVAITDSEAQRYFHENKQRFGNVPFENFKDNIKTYLAKAQSDKRLREWFDVLHTKYRVRNFQAEI